MIVAIDAAGANNGATEVFPGYHQQGCLTPRDGQYHQLPDDAVDLSTGVVLDLAPGDVAIFSGFTPHRSGAEPLDRLAPAALSELQRSAATAASSETATTPSSAAGSRIATPSTARTSTFFR